MSPRIIFAIVIGTLLEYFDYILLIHFNFIIAPLFFPHSNSTLTTLLPLGLIAMGFISRPIGAFIYGNRGDTKGRRRTLSLTIFGIGLPTFCISCMPSYEQIGLLAPLILLFCRFFQGLSIGGEYPIAGILLMEHTKGYRRGLYSSILCASAGLGNLIALGCSYWVLLSGTMDWAWRIPFLFGAIAAILGYYLRQILKESPEFSKVMRLIGIDPKLTNENQWQEIFSNYKPFLITIAIGSFLGVLHWIPITYTSFYLKTLAHWPLPQVIAETFVMVATYTLALPIMGMISDSIGPRKLMLWSAAVTIIATGPLFLFLTHGAVILFQIGFALLNAAFCAAVHAVMSDLFPPIQRCRAISLGFSLGMGTLGGISPLIVAALGSHLIAASYIVIIAFFGLWSMVAYRPYEEKSVPIDVKLAA